MDNFTFDIPANADTFAVFNFIGRTETDDELQQELAFHINDICSTGGIVRFIAKGQSSGMRLVWKEKIGSDSKSINTIIRPGGNIRSFIVFFEKNDIELLKIGEVEWEDDEGVVHVDEIHETLCDKLVSNLNKCNASIFEIEEGTDSIQIKAGF